MILIFLSDADITPSLTHETIGEQFDLIKKKLDGWQDVSEYGDKSLRGMKLGEIFGSGTAQPRGVSKLNWLLRLL